MPVHKRKVYNTSKEKNMDSTEGECCDIIHEKEDKAGPAPSVTTKRGDKGSTDLFNGDRVSKTDNRIEALGQLDMAQAFVGKLQAEMSESFMICISPTLASQVQVLEQAQQVLHDAMANVATPPCREGSGSPTNPKRLERSKFHDTLTATIEKEAHAMEKQLPPLKKFVLPITTFSVHLARAQVRTAERWTLRVESQAWGTIDVGVRTFLNRFSDYLFILARYIDAKARTDAKIE